ncbi:hypothetical protein CPB83DRAFT_855638 [Crepidotus variabilis]|uniref:UBC core domain-containing protein n=1 Tax=Crepidotus variabilis TaxID=179855 RepID=A0A9P6EEV0_9AGAR|nr:hypothetical protein CPB83DRAFT_855638 [Crepidotus variabilis]
MEVSIPLETEFFVQDVVQKISNPEYIGIVMRSWQNEDPMQMEFNPGDPLSRPLVQGEVGVAFSSHAGRREIINGSDIQLVDRAFQPGDICKRAGHEVQSGVIADIKVRGRVRHAISQEELDRWLTVDDLKTRSDAEVGDYVVYNDWIGQVVEVFDENIVQLTSGKLVRLPEIGSRLSIGERGSHVLPPPEAALHTFLQFFSGAGQDDTVLYVKHNMYAIAWLAVNQTLSPAESEMKPRPERFWHGENLAKLTLISGPWEMEMRVGDPVELKDPSGVPFTQHGAEGDPTGILTIQVFRVHLTETMVQVLWQDGSRETLRSTEVIPHMNADEHDCWPGDHVILGDDGDERPAVVQTVDAIERLAQLRLDDTNKIESASLLELSTYGTGLSGSEHEAIGLHIGDFVFVHNQGTTNGSYGAKVPRIGEIETWVHEHCHYDDLEGWRRQMHDIGTSIASQRGKGGPMEKPLGLPIPRSGELMWCGEVSALNIDGTVQVTHPDLSTATYPLNRLTRLMDTLEPLEDEMWDEHDHGHDMDTDMWAVDENGEWSPVENGNEWEDMSEDSDTEEHNTQQTIIHNEMETEKPVHAGLGTATPHTSNNLNENKEETLDPWIRFMFLPSAPPDHHFLKDPLTEPSKTFTTRLRKEYRSLEGGLPETILVRTYEDRTDLWRILIFGPQDTPYQDAPFMIDWMLLSDFPHTPPKAYFHSWTNGKGRVNRNLYEDGKVCLSLLGTWVGAKEEMWNQRSTLLQVFVSVQGLVLIKDPWFLEPGYEKLKGTPQGILNSRMNRETSYTLSLGFIRHALDLPPTDFTTEIAHFYHTQHNLCKVIDDSKALITKSREAKEPATDDDWEMHCLPSLTRGAIMLVERQVARLAKHLQELQSSSQASAFSSVITSPI